MDCPFSPVKSPGSKLDEIQQHDKNHKLTGSLRKLKDSAADVHNLLVKWTALNKDGAAIISQITATKMDLLSKKADNSDTKENVSILPLSLESKCEALIAICRSMEQIVNKLAAITSSIQGVHALSQYQNETSVILFKTWTIQQFVDTFNAILEMYKKEHSLKQQLVQFVAHGETRELLMFYSSAWLHQPYIKTKHLVESLLLETGHK